MEQQPVWTKGRIALVAAAGAMIVIWGVTLALGSQNRMAGWVGILSMLMIIAGQVLAARDLRRKRDAERS